MSGTGIVALIDADVLAFISATSQEERMTFGVDTVYHVDVSESVRMMHSRVEEIRRAARAKEVLLAFSDPSRRYWRHDIYPSYKSSRVGMRRPEALSAVKEAIIKEYPHAVYPMLEADDVLGILATSHPASVVVSNDKDLRQIPGHHLNLVELFRGVRVITPESADRWHMLQTLMGDNTDGYPGCPGIGPKRAQRLLAGVAPSAMWGVVVGEYVRRGKTVDYALTQARVAKILRYEDWDTEKKEPKLWTPSTIPV